MAEQDLTSASLEDLPPKFTEIAIKNSFELRIIDAETRDALIKACRGFSFNEFIHAVEDLDMKQRRAQLARLVDVAYTSRP